MFFFYGTLGINWFIIRKDAIEHTPDIFLGVVCGDVMICSFNALLEMSTVLAIIRNIGYQTGNCILRSCYGAY